MNLFDHLKMEPATERPVVGLRAVVPETKSGRVHSRAEFGVIFREDGHRLSDTFEPTLFAGTERDRSVRLLKALNVLYARVWHGLTVVAPACLPRTGPAILVSNHTSGLDPSLIQSTCPRLVRWMMAKEYYDNRYAGWVYRHVGAIPVQRSGRDLAATRAALRALEAGHVLGVFPEGKISPTRDLLPFQSGVALLAVKSGAPVFPVRLSGSQLGKKMGPALVRRQNATIAFGPEIIFDRSTTSRSALEAATLAMESAVRSIDMNANERG